MTIQQDEMVQKARHPTRAELRDATTKFGRWRLACPYGMWTCADGRQVLFNRYYRPIYQRHPGQRGYAADGDEWVSWVEQQWFFNDGKSPVSYWSVPAASWKPVITEIDRVLTDWGLSPLAPRPRRS